MAPLHSAVERGNYTIMRQLLENDADVNVRNLDGETPLFNALTCAKKTRFLIDAGADVNARDECGQTALIVAASDWRPDDDIEVIRILLDAGADVNAVTEDGQSALQFVLS